MRIRLCVVMMMVLLVVAAAPAGAQDESQVYVVHGVPDVTVDVWVDGDPLLESFEPGTISDPVALAPGTYEIEVFEAGADPDEAEPLISASPEVPASANLSVVAHLDAEGNPTLGAFVNDVSDIAEGQARLTARHTAAAPEVDVRADGEVLFAGVPSGQEGTADVPTGTYAADVVLAGQDDPVLGPADLELQAGTLTIVYAIGSAEDATLDLLVQVISITPEEVPAGSAGLAVDRAMPWWAPLVLAIGLLLVTASGWSLTRRRV